MIVLQRLFESVQLHQGFQNPHSLGDYLRLNASTNALLIREQEGHAEVALCLEQNLVERVRETCPPEILDWNSFGDLSVVIEELSHFNLYCERAGRQLSVSQLEMEIQGEVDKFAVALDWLEQRNECHLKDQIFEQVFGEGVSWKPDLSRVERERYFEAHQVAKSFCRRVMSQDRSREHRLQLLKDFFERPLEEKHSVIHRSAPIK